MWGGIILEEKLKEVSNRFSIVEAVVAVSLVDYRALPELSSSLSDSHETEEKELDLEITLDDSNADYSSLNPALFESYYDLSAEYQQMFVADSTSYVSSKSNSEEEPSDTASETLTSQEAEETIIDIQYANIAGTRMDVNFDQRKKLVNYFLFNPIEGRLIHALNRLTDDVDYSRVY